MGALEVLIGAAGGLALLAAVWLYVVHCKTINRRMVHARHNLIAHPIAGMFWLFGCQQWGDWFHDNW